MALVLRLKCRYTLLFPFFVAFLLSGLAANGQQLTPAQVKALPECSLAKTNNNCKLIIDRSSPVAPSAVQMYSNQAVTVVVKNPKPYERYFLDYQTGQATLKPDVASSIVQGLLPSLAKAEVFKGRVAPQKGDCTDLLNPAMTTKPENCDSFVEGYKEKLVKFGEAATAIYRELDPFVSPDSHLPAPSTDVPEDLCKIQKKSVTECDLERLYKIQPEIDGLLQGEFEASGQIAVIVANLKALQLPKEAQELTAYQSIADTVAKDLLGYSQRITGLHDFDNGSQECNNVAKVTDQEKENKIRCVVITSNPDDEKVYHGMVTRAITYALNALNLVANSQEAVPDPTKKKLLASIVINFADSPSKPSALRWEASAGVFFSSLPVRSFSVAPVFTSGVITDNKIAQNVLHPTVVPFAAANYRISNDLGWTRWRSAIYLTGAVGVNPNTVSADFASGLSISWRSLMFSPLWHYGHDVRLTQGLYVGESLGASFKGSLATQTYWTSSFALGVSIRVPSLTGR